MAEAPTLTEAAKLAAARALLHQLRNQEGKADATTMAAADALAQALGPLHENAALLAAAEQAGADETVVDRAIESIDANLSRVLEGLP